MYIYVPIVYTDIPNLCIKFLEQETNENIAGISKYEYSRLKDSSGLNPQPRDYNAEMPNGRVKQLHYRGINTRQVSTSWPNWEFIFQTRIILFDPHTWSPCRLTR